MRWFFGSVRLCGRIDAAQTWRNTSWAEDLVLKSLLFSFSLSVCLSPHLHLNHPLFTETQSLNPSMHFFTKESRVSRSQDKIRERHFLSRCDILRLYRIYLTTVTYTPGEQSKKEERQLLIRTKNWCSMFCVQRETLHCCLGYSRVGPLCHVTSKFY